MSQLKCVCSSGKGPNQIATGEFEAIEIYVVALCVSLHHHIHHVNEARKQMFSTGYRKLDNLPPTEDALEQQVNGTVYQAGHIWGQSLIAISQLRSPLSWGWKQRDDTSPWTICGITLLDAAKGRKPSTVEM